MENKNVLQSGVHFDPRAKLIMLILCIIAATNAPSLIYELGLVFLVMIYGCVNGRVRSALSWLVVYGGIYLLTIVTLMYMTGGLRATFMASLGLFHKVYPCGMLSGIIVSTTKVSEFMSAMNKVHAPKKIVIPLAVMLRYIPTIREDWSFIKDAMHLRNVSPSLKGFFSSPGMTIECVYVPLMMASSKAADELSVAAVTRGIENPKPRTCLVSIQLKIQDWIGMLLFLAYLIAGHLE